MAFYGRNQDGQRKSFFSKLKSGISAVPNYMKELEIRHQKEREKARLDAAASLARQNIELKKEEVRVKNELKLAEEKLKSEKDIEETKERIEKARQAEKELEKVRFEHSRAGRAIASLKSGAAYLQPYAKKYILGQKISRRKRR